MDELDLIESKARAAIEDSKDLDSLAKATRILRDVEEKRKIRADLAMAQQKADHAAAERSSEKARFWTATLLPTLAFVVTAGALVWQIQQGKVTAQAEEDSQWRAALEKIELDPKSAHVGALEMESFFSIDQRKRVARIIAASLLAKIDDPNIFQLVFEDIETHQQSDLVLLARMLTLRLQDSYDGHSNVLNQEGCHQAKSSFKLFLSKPECFYADNDPAQNKEIEEIDLTESKLDSVTRELAALWANSKSGLTAANQDLQNIAFYTSDRVDYAGLNFHGSQLDGSGFYGQCDVSGAGLDNRKAVDYCDH